MWSTTGYRRRVGGIRPRRFSAGVGVCTSGAVVMSDPVTRSTPNVWRFTAGAVCVHVHAVPVHVGLTCIKDGPVVAGDDEPEVVAEVDRGCGSQAPQGDVDVV